MIIVAALIGLFLVVVGQRYYIKRSFSENKWNENLEAEMWFDDKEINEGEESSMTIKITNRKFMPLPSVLFKFKIGKGISLIDNENSFVSDNVYVRHVFTLMSYQRVTRKSRFTGSKRGYYPVESLDVIAYDLMFLSSEMITMPCDISIYVFPARSEYSESLKIPFRQIVGQTLINSTMYEDPFEFRGIREYQTYDNIKKINWNASAKTGELKVNQYFDTTKQSAVILLNLEKARCYGEDALQEESIRMARTLLEWFSAKGISTCVYTNARDVITGKEVHLDFGAGNAFITNALRTLARINLNCEIRAFSEIAAEHDDDVNSVYVMISANTLDSTKNVFNELSGKLSYTRWIVPCTRFFEKFESEGDISFVEVDVI
ncbi:MAG: DUF58 domain-containing protein [Lachnospiraceae bacterium]|nr:DUF58 domain-containing protein [Lachnospiraceae bacterium]